MSEKRPPYGNGVKDAHWIKLGSKVRDIITGFTGVAIGRTEWMYGCNSVCVAATEMKDGKPIENQWFDEQRVEVVEVKAPPMSSASRATTGGPQDNPTSPAH